MILLDTCLLIDYSRRRQAVVDFITVHGKSHLFINSIIQMEFLQGAINANDLRQIKRDLQGFALLPIQQPILDIATQLVETYRLSHQAKIPDMVIAATAVAYGLELRTYNLKDFSFIPNLVVSDQLTVS